jgi:hypothetical protein
VRKRCTSSIGGSSKHLTSAARGCLPARALLPTAQGG